MMQPTSAYADFLLQLLICVADEPAIQWIRRKKQELSEKFTAQSFYLAFAAVPRVVGRDELVVSPADRVQAEQLRKGFTPLHWTTDQAARALLLLSVPQPDAASYTHLLSRLFETGDVAELTALYKALPLLPFPEAHITRVTEGIRTNMAPVFEAIALENPYPADYLDENAWNQMVLKAIFTGKPIQKIIGLRARANASLARMLSDFAHERWAAGRPVVPDLWLPVAGFVNEAILTDLQKLIDSEEPAQRLAAALVCRDSNYPAAKNLLKQHPDLVNQLAEGLDWEDLR
ncbi:EboA domain-containing protein [Rhodoflexus caldus]|uniref:EboA domain-containing protein n=1 Tax=Rhodoflexus caldus TaxID=2891236 RepID=UPI00202A66F0|nr:EboA domain-containing protein [Rhodoflexus caldus]